MRSFQYLASVLLPLLISICSATPVAQEAPHRTTPEGEANGSHNFTKTPDSLDPPPLGLGTYPPYVIALAPVASRAENIHANSFLHRGAEYKVPETRYTLFYRSWPPDEPGYPQAVIPLEQIRECVEEGVRQVNELIAQRGEGYPFDTQSEDLSPESGWFITEDVILGFRNAVKVPTYRNGRDVLLGILGAAEQKNYRETARISVETVIHGSTILVANVVFTIPYKLRDALPTNGTITQV